MGRHNPEKKAEAVKAYESGLTTYQVAERLGVKKTVTPKGVEHPTPSGYIANYNAVKKTVTPKGVEHVRVHCTNAAVASAMKDWVRVPPAERFLYRKSFRNQPAKQ